MSSFESKSKRGLDSRLEHVPDHRGQLAIEPFEEHLTRQPIRPQFGIAHPTVELLFDNPLPSVIDVFVHDRQAGTTVRASVSAAGVQGNAKSDRPAISGNGRLVAFYSDADTTGSKKD